MKKIWCKPWHVPTSIIGATLLYFGACKLVLTIFPRVDESGVMGMGVIILFILFFSFVAVRFHHFGAPEEDMTEEISCTAVLEEAKLVPYERMVDSGSIIASATIAQDMAWELTFDNGYKMFWEGSAVQVGATYRIGVGGYLERVK